MTRVRSSGEKTTVRTSPTSSRARGSGDLLIRARLDRPGFSSTSSTAVRPSLTTDARITAWSAPARTSGASVATRCELSRER